MDEQEISYKKISARVDTDWYPYHSNEWFGMREICDLFRWFEQETRIQVTKKLAYDASKVKPFLEKNGRVFRIIDDVSEDIDWQSADTSTPVDIVLPFNHHKYVKLFPKCVICVAGEPNSGKTAYLLNCLLLNQHTHKWTLYNSETSREQLKERFSNFNGDFEIPNPAPFKVKERYDNFADVIDPAGYSIIDYIDADNEFWAIGQEISRIHKKLTTGVVICAIQKKPGFKTIKGQVIDNGMGYGGALTMKRPDLYIVMTTENRLTIKKGKSWRDPKVNPNGMTWTYKLVGGAKFIYERYYGDQQDQSQF